jgi:hypothetical protein
MVQFSGGAKVERQGCCRVCGRTLKNPENAARGIGPVCAAKGGGAVLDVQRIPPLVSDWRVVKSDSERRIVWIVDEDKGGKSVTNDADNVVAELQVNYAGFRFIYRDSMGNWDELLHDGGLHTGFAPARDMQP